MFTLPRIRMYESVFFDELTNVDESPICELTRQVFKAPECGIALHTASMVAGGLDKNTELYKELMAIPKGVLVAF